MGVPMKIGTIPAARFTRLGLTVAVLVTLGLGGGGAQAQDQPTVTLVPNASYGTVLTDPDGWTLYAWDGDGEGVSNCAAACAVAWPPYLIGNDLVAPDDLPGSLGFVDRGDGTWQVTFANRPLYYFSGDVQPGDSTGDGSMGFGAQWRVGFWGPADVAA